MGIQGLLPVLKSITRTAHVSKYRDKRVAVDAYCWLHKGAYSCSWELCEGIPTDKHVTYCMQRVNLLRHHGVIPVIVFDGGRLPMKSGEENTRQRNRQESLVKAAAHMKAGNKAAAYECYQRAVDISPVAAKRFVEALKAADVEFIVAPYEADAQMAYLALQGMVHAVITEDSDLFVYGCPRVFFKMDKNGDGQEILQDELASNRDPSFVGFTQQMFLEMCILSGCDFVKALPGIGVRKAHGYMKRLKSYDRVVRSIRYSGVSVPRDYEANFERALWTFRHQRVYCPQRRALVHLQSLPEQGLPACLLEAGQDGSLEADEASVLDFLGPPLPDDVAERLAAGDLDPFTLQEFEPLPPPVTFSGAQVPQPQSKDSGQQQRSGTGKPPINSITRYFACAPSSQASLRSRQHGSGPASLGAHVPGVRPAARAAQHASGCGSQPELREQPEAPFGGFRCGPSNGTPAAEPQAPAPQAQRPLPTGNDGGSASPACSADSAQLRSSSSSGPEGSCVAALASISQAVPAGSQQVPAPPRSTQDFIRDLQERDSLQATWSMFGGPSCDKDSGTHASAGPDSQGGGEEEEVVSPVRPPSLALARDAQQPAPSQRMGAASGSGIQRGNGLPSRVGKGPAARPPRPTASRFFEAPCSSPKRLRRDDTATAGRGRECQGNLHESAPHNLVGGHLASCAEASTAEADGLCTSSAGPGQTPAPTPRGSPVRAGQRVELDENQAGASTSSSRPSSIRHVSQFEREASQAVDEVLCGSLQMYKHGPSQLAIRSSQIIAESNVKLRQPFKRPRPANVGSTSSAFGKFAFTPGSST